jgi:hypothetical protein
MRTLAIIALTSVSLSLSSLGADAAPWCAQYRVRGGATNYGFYSFEQCLETVRGIGGLCSKNPSEAHAYHGQRRLWALVFGLTLPSRLSFGTRGGWLT